MIAIATKKVEAAATVSTRDFNPVVIKGMNPCLILAKIRHAAPTVLASMAFIGMVLAVGFLEAGNWIPAFVSVTGCAVGSLTAERLEGTC